MSISKKSKGKYIITELYHHLPFSTFGVLVALLVMGVLTVVIDAGHGHHEVAAASRELFHVFHPAHVFLSAMASTAMFVKHDGNLFKGAAIGFISSILLCTLSDAFFPFLGGGFLGADMRFHIDILEHPGMILPFAIIGTAAGLAAPATFDKATEFSHSIHVFVSSVASLLYLAAFGLEHWTHAIGGVFCVTILAVMLPCCLGDIVLPLACSHKHCRHGDVTEMEHRH